MNPSEPAGARHHLPPLLVLAVGNRSRGDDALGPALLDRLRAGGIGLEGSEVELLEDFQLQVEHALDLDGRRAVLFVDALAAGSTPAGAEPALKALEPREGARLWTHALLPEALLQVARSLGRSVPPAALLAIPGRDFGLGEGLSPPAQAALGRAEALARAWIAAHTAAT